MIRLTRRNATWFATVGWLMASGAPSLHGQRPASRVDVGPGIDTTLADVRQIVRLTREYLLHTDTSAWSRGLWSTAHPFDRRWADMTGPLAHFGFPATILGIFSGAPGDSVYSVRILHSRLDTSGGSELLGAVQRVYAMKASHTRHGWQLSNPFARESTHWIRRTHGRITFHYAPAQEPQPARMERATQFVDSIARLFAVPSPERLDYIVAASPAEYLHAIGVDYWMLPSQAASAIGGHASTGQGIVYAGDARQGEAYFHELAHAVLARDFGGGILGEGIPTWLGGARGRSTAAMYEVLVQYQEANPGATLDALVRGATVDDDPRRDDARRATGALFVEHVHRKSGEAGLRALRGMPANPADFLAAMRRHLGVAQDPAALELWWRRAAREARTGV
ncbi:MAG: hypothetical protein ACREMA_07570 [Longimicrobiales bacterium]